MVTASSRSSHSTAADVSRQSQTFGCAKQAGVCAIECCSLLFRTCLHYTLQLNCKIAAMQTCKLLVDLLLCLCYRHPQQHGQLLQQTQLVIPCIAYATNSEACPHHKLATELKDCAHGVRHQNSHGMSGSALTATTIGSKYMLATGVARSLLTLMHDARQQQCRHTEHATLCIACMASCPMLCCARKCGKSHKLITCCLSKYAKVVREQSKLLNDACSSHPEPQRRVISSHAVAQLHQNI